MWITALFAPGHRSRRRRLPLLVTVLGAALLPQCRPGPPPANLLLLVTDTLRADALSCYGGAAPTPHICSLAERGALFERAYANAPWTPPSAVSIFTGNYPTAYVDPESAKGRSFWVSDEEVLLAEVLRERGYDVHFQSQSPLAEAPNTLQGFEPLAEPARPMGAALAGVDKLADYLWNHDGSPFFLLGWVMDPHAPYRPRRGLARPEVDRSRLARPLHFYMSLGHRTPPRMRDHAPSMSDYELELLRRLYHMEVEWVDEKVGGLLRALDAAGLRERTYVVFTSDHGEAFGEHGIFLHGHAFYDELVRVPLIVAGPEVVAGRRIPSPVSLADLTPTLRDLLTVEDRQAPQGKSLAPLLRGPGEDEASRRAHYLASSNESTRGVDALLEGSYKLIALPSGAVELYDLSDDPGERRDLATAQPGVVSRMRAHLERIRDENDQRRRRNFARQSETERLEARERTVEGLRELGYIE